MPSGARCEVCRRTCGSSDVLAGLRCEWCGVQVRRGGAQAPPFYGCRNLGVGAPFCESGPPLSEALQEPSVLRIPEGWPGPACLPQVRGCAPRSPPAPKVHAVCSAALAPECSFGRLRTMVLPPACVRLLSRNFSKMHCFRISESAVPEPGERGVGPPRGTGRAGVGGAGVRGPLCASHRREGLRCRRKRSRLPGQRGASTGVKYVPSPRPLPGPSPHPFTPSLRGFTPLPPGPDKQTLRIFDGSDAVHRGHFRVISVPRLARSEEVLVSAPWPPPLGGGRAPQWAALPPQTPPRRRQPCEPTTSRRTPATLSCRRSRQRCGLATPRPGARPRATGRWRRRAAGAPGPQRVFLWLRPGSSAPGPAPRTS